MLRAFLLSLTLATAGFLIACNEGSVDPISSTDEISGARVGSCPLTDEIADVFSPGGLRNAVANQCSNIDFALDRGDTADAIEKAFALIDKILGHHADGETTGDDEAVATLLNELLALVGLEGIFPTEVDENTGGGTCDNDGCTIVNPSGIAGIQVPPQTDLGMCYISFTLREFDPELFAGFDNYPFQFEYEIVCADEANGGVDLAQNGDEVIFDPAAIVGVCFADPPLGPTLDDVPAANRQLAHLPDGAEEPDLLPVATADFLDDDDCFEASQLEEVSLPFRALAKLEPISEFFVAPLWANPGRLGGAIAAFSPVGPVDNRGQAEENGGITGTVIGCFESFVPGAEVELYTSGEEFVAATTSDAGGSYSFTDVPPGDYFLQASFTGLTFDSENATVVSGQTTHTDIGPPTSGCIF